LGAFPYIDHGTFGLLAGKGVTTGTYEVLDRRATGDRAGAGGCRPALLGSNCAH
jgi:hypothetical protein